MEPVYKNMHSYPNQKDQMCYGPLYYPGMEAVPTQMYMNPARPPVDHGCWPWGSGYGYASPVACHGCCSHAYAPPHYAWGSPFSHVPPRHFPVQYMQPPPFYAMEQPRYEYEKSVPLEHHCCGCPSHPHHPKEQKSVRIEEEEPERERRGDDSLVPLPSRNSPYPIVWLPPDYSSNKEHGVVKNVGERKDGSGDVKGHENGKIVGQKPTLWNGWLPLDLNNLASQKQKGDREENREQDDGRRNFPFPVFWIPYKPEEKEKENRKAQDAITKPSLESENGSGGEQNFNENRENIGDLAASKARDIPVKVVKQHVEKETSKKQEKDRHGSVKDSSGSGEKKVDNGDKASSTEDGSKRKSPSPPKSSNLPPVCLRVDPLPRKKNGNGSSRSPSPPRNKQKPDSQSNDAGKVLNSSENTEQAKILQSESKEGKGTKIIKVVDGSTSQGKPSDVKVETPVKLAAKSQDDGSMNQAEEKPKEEHTVKKCTENDAVIKGQSESAGVSGGKNEGSFKAQEDEVKESCKRRLSEEEAAVTIQSAYRGFDVRRWEPIKKLRQIAKVQEQIDDVKHLIQAIKSSSDIQGRNKQRNIVAETIMSLLLKLDTIQGLHTSVREARKSVVRELVSLQEQLDSLVHEKPENSAGQESMTRRDKDALNKSGDVISPENSNGTTPTDFLEARQNQSDGGSNHENSEVSEADPIEKETVESSMNKGVEPAPEPSMKEDETFAMEDRENLVLVQGSELSSLQDEASAKETNVAAINCDALESDLAELPRGVLDVQEGRNDAVVEADTSRADQVKQLEEPLMESPIISEDTADKDNNQTVETHEVSALPLNGVNVERETRETCPIERSLNKSESDDNVGVEEEVDNKTGDAGIEPDECIAQQPQNNIVESSEASDGRELPNAEARIENHTTCIKLQQNSAVADSNGFSGSEEPLDAPAGKEMPSQLLQEGNVEQETSLINESANTDEATDMTREGGDAEAKSADNRIDSADNCITPESIVTKINDPGEVSEERQPEITEVSRADVEVSVDVPQQGKERDTEQPLPKETLEEQGLKDASSDNENAVDPTTLQVSPARDEVTESNRKLIEENGRLRDMMEKLIKSGQEQLTAISSLSERVKDLEKRLSRKKKLKVKQYRAPRSGSSCMTKFDGSADRTTVGVAM